MERDQIINILNRGIVDLRDIRGGFNISRSNLIQILDELVKENIVYHKKDTFIYGLIKKGRVILKDTGYGFIDVEDEERDYFANQKELENIYDGDIVEFYPYDDKSKLLNAHVIKVVSRSHQFIIGKYTIKQKKGKEKAYIESLNPKFNVKAVVKNAPADIEAGLIVYASINYVGTALEATVKEVLGHKDDPGIEISQIALEHGFQTLFPVDVIEEISTINDYVSEDQKEGRADFTDRLIITIDGDDSKDFDDAISLTTNDDGSYNLGVYIADVAEYVKENTPLDKEALKRGTSVYLADRVIPMIPHKLSNGICSLNENVCRLVLACLMRISKEGNLVDYEIVEGVIKSRHRMTYNNVNKMLNKDKEVCEKYSDLVDTVDNMYKLSQLLRKNRVKKGCLEFDVKEYGFKLNPDGSPAEIIQRSTDKAEKLIEDFMLMANETVAYNMNILDMPCVYRVHEKPDQDRLRSTFTQIGVMGVDVELPKKDITPKQIQGVLGKIDDLELKPIINTMLLRSMMKARYAKDCLGHYGLAMRYYCHFTSPIRRYPDLMVHRLIKNLIIHPENLQAKQDYYNIIVSSIALANSTSERNAIDCERAVDDMLYAWYMENNLDRVCQGVITSTTSFGMFISLENGVEGLVSLDNMVGYFTYDPIKMTYKSGKKVYSLGQQVEVVVVGADRKSRKVDFMFSDDYYNLRR